MDKYVGINALGVLIANIKEKFAERQHIHEISDIDGLQRKFDELAIPPDIETSVPSKDICLTEMMMVLILDKVVMA